jgi:hypothetical protein
MGKGISLEISANDGQIIEPSEEEAIEYISALLAELAILAQQEINDDYVRERVCEVIAAFDGCISRRDPKSLC